MGGGGGASTKIDLKGIGFEGVNWIHLMGGAVAGIFEHSPYITCSTRYLRVCWFLRKDAAPCNWLYRLYLFSFYIVKPCSVKIGWTGSDTNERNASRLHRFSVPDTFTTLD
jgi:hypothetical protein